MQTEPGNYFAYDGDGNSTQAALDSTSEADPTWDALGRMTSLNAQWFWPAGAPEGAIESFGYDARGLRVEAMEPDVPSEQTFYVYDGSTLLGEVAAGANEPTPVATAAYTWGADGLVSERLMNQPGGVPDASLWYHYGPQGETRQLTDGSGNVADTYEYTAYGMMTASTGSDVNPYRYGGQFGYYAPLAANFYLCGLRWYDADTGRFLSRDPIGYDGGDKGITCTRIAEEIRSIRRIRAGRILLRGISCLMMSWVTSHHAAGMRLLTRTESQSNYIIEIRIRTVR